jgi:hypothetical protein
MLSKAKRKTQRVNGNHLRVLGCLTSWLSSFWLSADVRGKRVQVVYGQGLSPEKERRKIAAIMAPAQNFKHTISPRLQSPQEGGDLDFIASGTEVDISSALVGKRPRRDLGEDNDDDLQDMIHFISKRDIKIGTEFLKKTKGKLTKGEVGGGSFQSMGKTFKVIPSNI